MTRNILLILFSFITSTYFQACAKAYDLCNNNGNFNPQALFGGHDKDPVVGRYSKVNKSTKKAKLCDLNLNVPKTVSCTCDGYPSRWVIDFVQEYINGSYTPQQFKDAMDREGSLYAKLCPKKCSSPTTSGEEVSYYIKS